MTILGCMKYLMAMKLKKLFLICATCAVTSFIFIIFYQNQLTHRETYELKALPNLVWWTPFTLRENLEELKCSETVRCAITDNRQYADIASGFLFYGSGIQNWDLPVPRQKHHVWGLFHEESPKNVAVLLDDRGLDLFNITSTFSRHSDVPLTLNHLTSFEDLTSLKYYVPMLEKDELRKSGYGLVLYIQSDCETPLNRDSYVAELMKYVKVDSYGKCLRNSVLPKEMQNTDHLKDLYEANFMELVSKYKFTLAIENAACDDYVTEKLWRPLIAGSVPIYLGSPTVVDWLPDGAYSAILVQNFTSPKELAEYLIKLDQDSRKYERHLQHKLSKTYPITNEKLKKAIKHSWASDTTDLIKRFECKLCESVWGMSKNDVTEPREYYQQKQVSAEIAGLEKRPIITVKEILPKRSVYNCSRPISPVNNKVNASNWWTQHWDEAPCHFNIMNDVLQMKINLTEREYNNMVFNLYRERKC